MNTSRQSVFLLFLSIVLLLTVQGLSQETKKTPPSPVFKRSRQPVEVLSVPESDALNQIWEAFVVARKAGEGDKFAQHELGLRYIAGRGVEKDTAKAAHWFGLAAAQGLVASEFNLAIITYHGWGIPWDPFEAYRLVKECAEEEMAEAEFLMAAFLTEDLAVDRNWSKAYDWAKRAADAGYEPAQKSLPDFAARLEGKPSNDAPLPIVADAQTDTAGSSGNPRVLKDVFHGVSELRNALGISKMIDDSVKMDSSALNILRQAARYGSPEALTVLGRCYEKGIEVKPDSVEAAALYVRAIRLDSPKAPALMQALLRQPSFDALLKRRTERGDRVAEFVTAGLAGLRFESGVSDVRALQLLRKAVDAAYVPAIVELGLWEYSGKEVTVNVEKAKQLWYQAVSLGSIEASIRLAVIALRDTTDRQMHAAQIGLLRAAAAEGSVLADVAIGYTYELGIGIYPNAGEAARYYRSAASRGSQDAYRALRRMYDRVRPKAPEFRLADG